MGQVCNDMAGWFVAVFRCDGFWVFVWAFCCGLAFFVRLILTRLGVGPAMTCWMVRGCFCVVVVFVVWPFVVGCFVCWISFDVLRLSLLLWVVLYGSVNFDEIVGRACNDMAGWSVTVWALWWFFCREFCGGLAFCLVLVSHMTLLS